MLNRDANDANVNGADDDVAGASTHGCFRRTIGFCVNRNPFPRSASPFCADQSSFRCRSACRQAISATKSRGEMGHRFAEKKC